MTDEKLDLILRQALSPEIDDKDIKINTMERKQNMKHIEHKKGNGKNWKALPVAAASVAVLTLSTITVYAAWHYFSARDVATETADNKLAQEFDQNNWMDECETQSFGDYDITLLGVVSGNEISDHLSKDDLGNIDGDKTYVSVAISHSDGSPMPDPLSADSDSEQFYVSPYINGLDPAKYNVSALGSKNTIFVSDGIQYRLLETDNIECFADQGIYIGVSEGSEYDENAYLYDSATGALSRNEAYEGVNALFSLPIDPAMGDAEKAAEVKNAMDDYKAGGESTDILSEADRWCNSITPENIDEKAVPLESSRKTVTEAEFIEFIMEDTTCDEDTKAKVLKEYFPNGEGMSELIARSGSSMEDAYVETYTLNTDGTVTILRYVPNN